MRTLAKFVLAILPALAYAGGGGFFGGGVPNSSLDAAYLNDDGDAGTGNYSFSGGSFSFVLGGSTFTVICNGDACFNIQGAASFGPLTAKSTFSFSPGGATYSLYLSSGVQTGPGGTLKLGSNSMIVFGDGTEQTTAAISQTSADARYLLKGNDTATGLSSHTFQTIQVNTGILGSGVMSIDNAANFGTAPDKSTFTATGDLGLKAGATIYTGGGTLSVSTGTSASGAAIPALFVSTNGHIGMGTNNPGAVLGIQPLGSTNRILFGANTTDATYNSISLNGNNSSGRLGWTGGGGVDNILYYDSPTGGAHRFRLGTAVRYTMDEATGDFTWNGTNIPGNYYLKTDTVGQDLFLEGATGNVSIGRAGGAPLPATKLDVDGSFQAGSGASKSTFTVAGLLQMVAGSTITTNNGTLSFSTAASAALTTQTPIFITANGRVGIGGNRFNVAPTGSPTQPDANVLMLFGKGTDDGAMEAMMFTGQGFGGPAGSGAFTTSEKIILTNYASSKGAIFSPNDGAIGLIGTGDAAAFVGFFTNNTTANPAERMRVHSDGNVGISTDTPTSTLHVAGSAAFGSGLTQSSFTAAGFLNMSAAAAIALGSRTKAQLEAATSTAGQIYYCSDCSNSVRVVVGTTTLSGWDSLIGGTAWH